VYIHFGLRLPNQEMYLKPVSRVAESIGKPHYTVAFQQMLFTNIYKCQTLLGWQSSESSGCKVFKCTSGVDRQSLHTCYGTYILNRFIWCK